MSTIDAQLRAELLDFLLTLSRAAAEVVVPYFRQRITIDNKADAGGFDPVTEADRAAEQKIRQLIQTSYPKHAIIGEEHGETSGDASFCWVIDPIDGTRAFMSGLPTWATLIGLCEDGEPRLGIMNQPIVGDCFIGGMSEGRLLTAANDIILSTSTRQVLADCSLFATSPSMFVGEREIEAFQSLSRKVQMTRFGVDSYAYCLLAAGHIDLVMESGLGFYDVAAVIPLIEAAGGVISTWEGAPVRGAGRVLAAANPELHHQALAVINT